MQEKPPYLIDHADAGVTVSADIAESVIDVAVRGAWTETLGATVRTTIRKCLAESPAGIVVDLTGLDDEDAASAPAWAAAAAAAAAIEPATRFAVCVPPGTALASAVGPAARHDTVERARSAVRGRITHVIRELLEPGPFSASLARDLVGGACHDWRLPALLHPGRAIMSELVDNAVEHAGTEMDVCISRRGTALHLAVWDRDPTLPSIRALAPVVPGRPLDDRGYGLRVVHADSVAWGAMPGTAGKMVWATVRGRHP